MNPNDNEELNAIREGVRALCAEFDAAYWRKIDEEKGFPEAFVKALTDAGWLSAMIPEQYGGSGLGLAEASVILEEVNRCGGNSGTVHGQMYNMFTLLRHGSEAQKRFYLPKLASGELRLQSMGVTEPTTGTEGYSGLVVHGPLIATLSLRAFCRANPGATLRRFAYRGVRPLIAPQPFEVGGRVTEAGVAELWASNADGLAQQASVHFE